VTPEVRAALGVTALAILARYAPPPLDVQEFRRRAALEGDQRVAAKRNYELNQSVLQAMNDPEWKRHPVLQRAFFDAANARIQVDDWSLEVIAWADRLAAIGQEPVKS
jgi:hypothetical protein